MTMSCSESRTTQASALWSEMARTFSSWPKGVVPVPEPVRGTAFFPGGLGLLLDDFEEVEATSARVMVVGQDFNTFTAYQVARTRGSEFDSSQTWRNLRKVFPRLGLTLRTCFFTNFYMGLREHGPETGRFPGARDPAFTAACGRFFERQMEAVRPELIVTLGLAPLKALGRELFGFAVPDRLADCDHMYQSLPAKHGPVTVVALTHPSLYFSNVPRRRFEHLIGIDAERAMIERALGR